MYLCLSHANGNQFPSGSEIMDVDNNQSDSDAVYCSRLVYCSYKGAELNQ